MFTHIVENLGLRVPCSLVAQGTQPVQGVGFPETIFALANVRLTNREGTVTGKGGKQRTVRFTYDMSRVLDGYARERAKHPDAHIPALRLGVKGGAMTASGIYQMG